LIPILAVLTVVPVKSITGVSGFMDAVSLTFSIYGPLRHALVDIVALAFIFTLLTQGSAWMMGSDRVLAAVGMDGTFPRWLGVFSSRFGTPVRVNLISGAVATVFVVVATNLTSGSASNAFAVVLTVAISTVLMSYLIIYPAALVLRRKRPSASRPFVVPFGHPGIIAATICATFFAALGTWVALVPGVLERLFGLSYDFVGTWGVSRGRFEALTLGTMAVIVVLSGIGLATGALERRREATTDRHSAEIYIGSSDA
jgi:amino acid transporter